MDPKRFGQENFINRVELLFEEMLADPEVRLPGDRRLAMRQKTQKQGVDISETLFQEVREISRGPK
jgi:(2R)-3-sulfolactate dehydrogenase (NADP+)